MPTEYHDTLQPGEPHPGVNSAMEFLNSLGIEKLLLYREAFSSCAIEGNRAGAICSGTINRLLAHEQVSDRYILGLAWTIMEMER